MIEMRITPEDTQLADLVASLEFMSSKVMPKTYKAFKMAAAVIQYTWKSYALGAPIPGTPIRLKHPTGAYARSIKTRFLTPFNYEIYSDSPVALYLERGVQTYDMKETHPYGKRSRVSKEGIPYLIIPFRHGVPGSKYYSRMPEQLYKKLREAIKRREIMLSHRAKGRKYSPNYSGELVPRAKYAWGTRISGTGLEQFEGMIMADVSTPKSNRSTYMTFRVISANSPAHKWIVKTRPAMEITKHVAINTKEIVSDVITSGIKQDLGMV